MSAERVNKQEVLDKIHNFEARFQIMHTLYSLRHHHHPIHAGFCQWKRNEMLCCMAKSMNFGLFTALLKKLMSNTIQKGGHGVCAI